MRMQDQIGIETSDGSQEISMNRYLQGVLMQLPWLQDASAIKMIIDNMPIIVSVYNDTRNIYVNSTFEKTLGYSLEEIQQKKFWDIIHPEHQEIARKRALIRLRGGKAPSNYELKFLKKNGEEIWLHLFLTVTYVGGENINVCGAIDITESKLLKGQLESANSAAELLVKQRTKELRKANHELQQVNQALNQTNQELIFANQTIENVLKNMSDGVMIVRKSGEFELLNSLPKLVPNQTRNEIKAKLRDLYLEGKMPYINRMLDQNESFSDREIALPLAMGTHYLLASGTPILNEKGDVTSGVIVLRSIKEVHKLVNLFSGARATFLFKDIITQDHNMMNLIENAKRSAIGMSNILIQGESGTGKELFAQAIHNESSRNKSPFLAVNCGAIPRELIGSEMFGYTEGAFTGALKGGSPGKFELANGGTMFLDEIGDLPFEQQAALLRVIQEKSVTRIGGRDVIPIDVRIICATNKDLSVEMNKGTFRHDLYYRLNVINIKIPPLRERPNDILILFKYFLDTLAPKFSKSIRKINDGVLDRLLGYHWPGNVRELQNIAERMLNSMVGTSLEIEHLPIEIKGRELVEPSFPSSAVRNPSRLSIKEARDLNRQLLIQTEKNQIIRLLGEHRGNISRVAKEMGLSRTTLYRKMTANSL